MSKMRRKELLIIVFIIPHICFAEIFKGTIGKYPIVISFSLKDIGRYSDKGGYFYESKRQNIIFTEATGNENHIVLKAGYENDNSIEKFDLTRNSDGSYSGTWTNKSKKTYPVQISTFDIKSVKNKHYNLQKINEPIDELWYIASSKLNFNIDTMVFVGKHKIEWLKDNIYGVSFFRIVSNRNPDLNKLLVNKHLELINSLFRGCNCDAENFEPFEIIETGANIISYSFKNGICYCYSAAHPVWGEETDNLDLQRDKVLDFDEVFAFSKTTVPNQEKQSLEWSTYRQEFVAPKIIEFLKKIDKSLLPTPQNYKRGDDEECYILETEYWWALENWLLNKKSIKITHYDSARGYGPCMQSFEIPSKFLKTNLREAYKTRIFKN